MDRAGRRFNNAYPFITVSMVLMMASISNGETTLPAAQATQHVVPAHRSAAPSETPVIRQVAGKQPSTPKTRPGLFEVLAGSSPSGNKNHHHKNMGQQPSRGLLDSVFGRTNEPVQHDHRSHTGANHNVSRSNQTAHPSPSAVNWDGIPYHAPSKSEPKQAHVPVQDPSSPRMAGQPSPAPGQTRIIRGGSARVTQAVPASVRPKESSVATRRDSIAASLPTPPADDVSSAGPSAIGATSDISATSSSRRSGRRDLTALEASIERSKSAPTKSVAKSPAEEVTLVPRVVAKSTIKSDTETKVEETDSPSESQEAQDLVASTETKQDSATPAETESPESNTALAAIGKPTAAPDTHSTDEVAAQATATPEPSGNYTLPIDPALSSAPEQSYAESMSMPSTPASAASHRSGPPMSAFQPIPPAYGSAVPAVNEPIGSGVVSNLNASEPSAASAPDFQTARLPGSESDPYGSHTHSPSNRLTTNGQPVEQGATSSDFVHQPSHPSRSRSSGQNIPMHSIPGHPTSIDAIGNPAKGSDIAADNFDRSTYAAQNQMRGAKPQAGMSNRLGAIATTSELPGIRVVTHGPSSIMIRQTSQFEIRVENRGSIDAEGVLVRSTVPDWADLGGQNASVGNVAVRERGSDRQLVWTIDHLPAGQSERMFVRLTAARSGNYDLDVDWTLLPQKTVAKVQVHEPRLDLTIEGPDEVVYGQSQTYKVHVLNPGDGTAPNVVFTLSPNSATPQTQRIGDIPPGKEAQFDVELTAQDLGDLKIHGLATGELDLRAEADKTIRVSAARLEAMLNGPELKYQNSEAVYKLQVQNTGSVASEKIIATLRMPAGVDYIDGIEGVTPHDNTLRWEITALPPGAIRNYQFRCQMTSTGSHRFAFDCKGTAAGNAAVALSTQVESIADLVLTVNDPAAPAPIGSDVTYEIVIRNRGSKEATDVRAVAQFSHGIEPQRIEGQSGEVVTGQVLFDPIGQIGAGQEVRLRVIAKAERGGHHRFRSEVRSGDTVLVAEEATHYMSPKSERVSRHSNDSSTR